MKTFYALVALAIAAVFLIGAGTISPIFDGRGFVTGPYGRYVGNASGLTNANPTTLLTAGNPSVNSVLTNKSGGPAGWLPVSVFSGAAQTPWASDINAATFNLTNALMVAGNRDAADYSPGRINFSPSSLSGNVTIAGGTNTTAGDSANGGNVVLLGGRGGNGSTVGGDINLTGGYGVAGTGGSINLTPGTGGTDGTINLNGVVAASTDVGVAGNVNVTGTIVGNGNSITNVKLSSIVSVTNSWGSQQVDFSAAAGSEVTTNASGGITFVLAVANANPTNYNYKTYHVKANGANRTTIVPTGWSSTRTAHITTNGGMSDFTVSCQVGQFTNLSQVDFTPAP